MKKRDAGMAMASGQVHLQERLSRRLIVALRSLFKPASSQHVGMFAGSLLPYDSGPHSK